jgi:hypothetical protein
MNWDHFCLTMFGALDGGLSNLLKMACIDRALCDWKYENKSQLNHDMRSKVPDERIIDAVAFTSR